MGQRLWHEVGVLAQAFDAFGMPLSPWVYAAAALLLAYLRNGGLSALARSSVNGIHIGGEIIGTPVRGLVNGFVVLVSAGQHTLLPCV